MRTNSGSETNFVRSEKPMWGRRRVFSKTKTSEGSQRGFVEGDENSSPNTGLDPVEPPR